MNSSKNSNVLHEVTVAVDKASLSICGTSDFEDEIEILANSEYDGCCIRDNKVTFYSLVKPGVTNSCVKRKTPQVSSSTTKKKRPRTAGSRKGRRRSADEIEILANSKCERGKVPELTCGTMERNWPHITASGNGRLKCEIRHSSSSPRMSLKESHRFGSETQIKAQDIVWARHTANLPFWPAYVKRVSSSFVYLFYISRTNFSSKVLPHKKNKNEVILFSLSNSDTVMKQGLDYYRKRVLWNYFSEFHNAVSLAKTYISLKPRGHLSVDENIFHFFNSDLPKREMKDFMSPPTTLTKVRKRTVRKRLSYPLASKKRKAASPSGFYENFGERQTSDENAFDSLSERIFDFILQGRCENHIEQVLKRRFPCARMKVFYEDSMTPRQRKEWELDNVRPYFLQEDQQHAVMRYLRESLLERQKRNKEKMAIMQFIKLLFDVIYPESIIWAISKVRRIPYDAAETVYIEAKASSDDYVINLSPSEKEKMRLRLKEKGPGLQAQS